MLLRNIRLNFVEELSIILSSVTLSLKHKAKFLCIILHPNATL